jgi:general stress protein CsbA
METTYPISAQDTEVINLHRMIVMQPGEQVVCVISRHPMGIIQQYIGATFAIIVASALVLLTVPGSASTGTQTLFYLGLFILVLVLVAILGAATRVYWENHWVITSDSLTQVVQGSLFGAQVSSLSLENLEDITVDQHGMLPHMFAYGTLKAETAGDHSKFQFAFCPNPTEYARKIIDAKEKYLATKE